MQLALLLTAVIACASSVMFIKESLVDSALLAALRLTTAAILLTPVYLRDLRKHRAAVTWRMPLNAVLPGIALGLHLITWNIGARMTLGANATLIVNLVPLVMPVLLTRLAHERLSVNEFVATIVATLGLAVMFVTDYHAKREHFQGDLICLASMSLLALYLVLGRRHRKQPTLWLYMVPLFYAGGATAFACTPFLAEDVSVDWGREWRHVAALVLLPTLLGHVLFNNAMRYFRGQLVGLASMCQFIFAAAMLYFFLGETPRWSFYPAAILTLMGGGIAFWAHHKEPASVETPSAKPEFAAE